MRRTGAAAELGMWSNPHYCCVYASLSVITAACSKWLERCSPGLKMWKLEGSEALGFVNHIDRNPVQGFSVGSGSKVLLYSY